MATHPLRITLGGATLQVGIAAPRKYVGAAIPARTWPALIDTGANMSVISPAVVAASVPPEIGYFAVGRAGGFEAPESTYDIRLRLGGHSVLDGQWFRLEAVEIQPATPDVDVIIGTDLLIELQLHWNGPARTGWLGSN